MTQLPKLRQLLELESFRFRVALYIGEKKISNLNAFLNGIYYTLDAYEIESNWLLKGFSEWVADFYQWHESTAGWKNIILTECDGDEGKSVDVFFSLYDQYRSEKVSEE